MACLIGGWSGGRDVAETDDVRFDRMIDLIFGLHLQLSRTFFYLREMSGATA